MFYQSSETLPRMGLKHGNCLTEQVSTPENKHKDNNQTGENSNK